MAGRKTVLVVDDEHYIVELLADLLEDEGYRVARAQDGLAALEAFERQHPDLVIADVMMPRLDGLSLAQRLRERAGDLPIVLMSAAVPPGNYGFSFLPKPFDINVVLDTVDRLVK